MVIPVPAPEMGNNCFSGGDYDYPHILGVHQTTVV
jgi:hypothetical protein